MGPGQHAGQHPLEIQIKGGLQSSGVLGLPVQLIISLIQGFGHRVLARVKSAREMLTVPQKCFNDLCISMYV